MTDTSDLPIKDAYEFTNDWFLQNAAAWPQVIARNRPRRIVEIGSFEGQSTCWMAENCSGPAQGPIEICCIDTWDGGVEHQSGGMVAAEMSAVERRFDRNIAIANSKTEHPVKVTKMKARSGRALADLIASGKTGYFDMVYIDGSHQAPDVLTDAVMAFQILRVGGLMIFDDYLWSMEPPGQQDVLNMPKPAVDAFLNIFQRKMSIMRNVPLNQLFANKIAD